MLGRSVHQPSSGVKHAISAVLGNLTADQGKIATEEIMKEAAALGCTQCYSLEDGHRRRVTITGRLKTITLRPRKGALALEAELFDGTGTTTLIWLGRREIRGIHAGSRIQAEGMASMQQGRVVIYNPAYELLQQD